MSRYLIEQMAMYSAYHRDVRTRLTHFVGVPSIAFALLLPLALIGLFEVASYTVSLAILFTVAVAIYWIALEPGVGFVTTLFYLPLLLLAEQIAARGAALVWILFAGFFVGGWIFQLLGHALFEGRKPALLDNLIQVFIAPFFLVAEVLFALGLRRSLQQAVESRWRHYSDAGAKDDGLLNASPSGPPGRNSTTSPPSH